VDALVGTLKLSSLLTDLKVINVTPSQRILPWNPTVNPLVIIVTDDPGDPLVGFNVIMGMALTGDILRNTVTANKTKIEKSCPLLLYII
jgi:hypothetical protein